MQALEQIAEQVPGVGVSFDLTDPNVEAFLQARQPLLEERASQVTSNFAESIARVVEDGNRRGLPLTEIADNIAGLSEDITPARAVMIARTETGIAHQEAALFAAQQSGVVRAKRWRMAPNPCEFCGQRKPATIAVLDHPSDRLGEVARDL